jgi:hypothetical protein
VPVPILMPLSVPSTKCSKWPDVPSRREASQSPQSLKPSRYTVGVAETGRKQQKVMASNATKTVKRGLIMVLAAGFRPCVSLRVLGALSNFRAAVKAGRLCYGSMATMIKLQQKPNFSTEVERDLQLLGVEGVRDLLRVSTDGYHGTGGAAIIPLPYSKASRADLLAWLRYTEAVEARRETRRFWWTMFVAGVAAVAAVVAALEGYWPTAPRSTSSSSGASP